MSKTVYDEAIAEAKLLRSTAEQNAKNAIIEAVTPRIRSFIEDQLMNQGGSFNDDSDFLQEVASSVLHGTPSRDDISNNEEVVLDESALISLLEIFGDKKISAVKSQDAVKNALHESFDSLEPSSREKLLQIANKLNQNLELFEDSGIHNDVSVQQENSAMPRTKDVIYEVDLDELASMTAAMMSEEAEEDESEEDLSEEDETQMDEKEAEELSEIMRSLGLGHLINEDKIEIDLGDVELPEDIQILARALADEEEEGEVEVGEEEVEEIGLEDELPEELEEVFEIDEDILRSELRRLRGQIAEAKDLVKIKGIKDAKESAWGGSGSGKSGVKGAFGGSGGSKAGVKGSFGGGKESGDPLKVTLNKLSEAVKYERRKNRSLSSKLNEYRSAVETLREQLTDLNLFNAKLLYVNKLLQNKDVSASQRKTVVESIDNAKSLREVKLVFKTLMESFSKGSRGTLKESRARRALGSSSRALGRSSAQTVSSEVNRWAQLAGINEK